MLKNSSMCITFSPSDIRQVCPGLPESHLASFSLHHWVDIRQNADDTWRDPPLGTEWSLKVPMTEQSYSPCLFPPVPIKSMPRLSSVQLPPTHSESLLSQLFITRSVLVRSSWGLLNVPTDLTVILRAPSLFLTLNSRLPFDTYKMTHHKSC